MNTYPFDPHTYIETIVSNDSLLKDFCDFNHVDTTEDFSKVVSIANLDRNKKSYSTFSLFRKLCEHTSLGSAYNLLMRDALDIEEDQEIHQGSDLVRNFDLEDVKNYHKNLADNIPRFIRKEINLLKVPLGEHIIYFSRLSLPE